MRNLEKSGDLQKDLKAEKLEESVLVRALDVCEDDSVRSVVREMLEQEGRIDVLVNNAGYSLSGALDMVTLEECRAQFETNFFGVIRCCQAVIPQMKRQGSGRIVQVSTVGGLFGFPFQELYCASKHALEGLSESMAITLSQFGIHVTLVEPGAIRTPFFDNSHVKQDFPDEKTKELFGKVVAGFRQTGGAGQTPDEVAEVLRQVIEADKPDLRVQTSDHIRKLASSNLIDPTGNAKVKAMVERFGF